MLALASAVCALGSGVPLGCKGDDNPSAPAAVRVDSSGGVVTSDDGVLTVTVPPGALDDAFDIRISRVANRPPSSLEDAYEVTPSGLLFNSAVTVAYTDRHGEITSHQGAPLSVAYFANGSNVALTSAAAGGVVTAQVTHLGTFGLALGRPFAGRDDVASAIRSSFVPAMWSPYLVVSGPGDALGDGAHVRSGFGGADHVTRGTTWFFWADLLPGAAFGHHSVFLYVDPRTGTITEEASVAWPVIDGVPFLPAVRDRLDSTLTIYKGDLENSVGIPPVAPVEPLVTGEIIGSHANGIVVQDTCAGDHVLILRGSDERMFTDSTAAVSEYLTTNAKYPASAIDEKKVSTQPEVLAAIEGLIRPDGLPWCELVVYIASHGDVGALVPSGPGEAAERQTSYNDVLERLYKVKAKKITIVIESCQAGGINALISDDRRVGHSLNANNNVGPIADRARGALTFDATIITSSKAGRSAFNSSLAALPGKRPMKFTSYWLSALRDSDKPRDFTSAGILAVGQGRIDPVLAWSTPTVVRWNAEPLPPGAIPPIDDAGADDANDGAADLDAGADTSGGSDASGDATQDAPADATEAGIDGGPLVDAGSGTWMKLTSPTTHDIMGVYGTGGDVLVIDSFGSIFHSVNQGQTWTLVTTSWSAQAGQAIGGNGASDIYAISANGAVVHAAAPTGPFASQDWVAQNPTFGGTQLTSLSATQGVAFAVGSGGAFLSTSNQGATWSAAVIKYTDDAGVHTLASSTNAVVGASANEAFAFQTNGFILHTTNRGQSWTPSAETTPPVNVSLLAGWSPGASTAYAAGNQGTILYTNDGTTWTRQAGPLQPTSRNLRGVWGASANDVYAVGDNGTIAHAINGLGQWTLETSTTTSALFAVGGAGSANVYAGGQGGIILRRVP